MRAQRNLFLLVTVLICAGSFFAFPSHGTAQPPAKPPELKVLNRFIGKWKYETISRKAEWSLKEVRSSGTSTNEWALDGWFQLHNVKDEGGTESIQILTYDPRKKAYRYWGFYSNGLIKELTGAWDEKAKTLTMKADLGGGIRAVEKFTFRDSDNREATLVVKDAAGKIYLDMRSNCSFRQLLWEIRPSVVA